MENGNSPREDSELQPRLTTENPEFTVYDN